MLHNPKNRDPLLCNTNQNALAPMPQNQWNVTYGPYITSAPLFPRVVPVPLQARDPLCGGRVAEEAGPAGGEGQGWVVGRGTPRCK